MNVVRSASFLAAFLLINTPPTIAQDHGMKGHAPGIPHATSSPYAGLEKRLVKALSDQQMADLRAGRGMSLALAAELNGYPGPLHVLEFADALELSDNQKMKTTVLLEAMKAETIPIGERIIADETELNRLFAERHITRVSLEAFTSRIGASQGELRAAHLRYHLEMLHVLSPEQIARYAKFRGYTER